MFRQYSMSIDAVKPSVGLQTQLKSIIFEDRAQQMKIEDSFYGDYG